MVLTVDVLRHKDKAGEDISVAYNAGDDAAVIERVDRTLQGQAISSDNVSLLFWKAESQYRSGQADAAIATYLDAIAKVESVTNNITRREFVETYFRFAALLREKGRFERAIAVAEAGLRVQPQNVAGQIFLGQLLDDSGQHDRALAHYQKLLASSVPVSE